MILALKIYFYSRENIETQKVFIFLQSTRRIGCVQGHCEIGCVQGRCSEYPRRPPKRPIPFPRFPSTLNIEIWRDECFGGLKVSVRRRILPSIALADMC
jgi:hypothetical protein